MPVNSLHPQYEAHQDFWQICRDVLAGDQAVKAAGERYLPRLDSMNAEEYRAYVERGFFFNATARTVDGLLGLIFRRAPAVNMPQGSVLAQAFDQLVADVDLRGSTLDSYSRRVVSDVMALGRCGTLVDWETDLRRASLVFYTAEQILNWRMAQIAGRWQLELLVLKECVYQVTDDPFQPEEVEQIRIWSLKAGLGYMVDVYQRLPLPGGDQKDWQIVSSVVPVRLGKPLPAIPFVFHGPQGASSDVARSPVADIVAANLDHYRLSTDLHHGMHYTALPTAWVAGFNGQGPLKLGSTTAWTAENVNASAGFLEFKGDGLQTFERALDRCERLMSVLGSRLLQGHTTKVSESAEAISIRQSGENSVIASLATSCSASLTHVLRWVYWWNSVVDFPHLVTASEVLLELNTDFDTGQMTGTELTALVAAWQGGAISRDTLLYRLKSGEVLPPGRTVEEGTGLIERDPAPMVPAKHAK